MANLYLNDLRLIEVDGVDEDKSVFEVLMIAPGLSLNGKFYSEDLLRAAAPLFEGVRSLARTDDEHVWGGGQWVKNLVGFFRNVTFREGAGIVGELHVKPESAWLANDLRFALSEGKLDLLGFSIVASGTGHEDTIGSERVVIVDMITDARFVDVVVNPGAGGQVIRELEGMSVRSDEDIEEATVCTQASLAYSDARAAELALEEALTRGEAGFDRTDLLEARRNGEQFLISMAESAGISGDERRGAVSRHLDPTLEEEKMRRFLIESIMKAKPEYTQGALDAMTEAELQNIVQGLLDVGGSGQTITESAPTSVMPVITPVAPAVPAATPQVGITEAETRIAAIEATMNRSLALLQRQTATLDLREALATEDLPKAFADDVQARLQAQIDQGVDVTHSMIAEAIRSQRKLIANATQAGIVVGEGKVIVELGESQTDKSVQMLEDFFDPKKGEDISFREAYVQLTGDRHITGHPQKREWEAMQHYAEATFPDALREAVTTGAFDLILGDTLNRRMVEQYSSLNLDDWQVLTRISTSSDFRPQHRVRFGGYPNFPTVSENNAYTALTTPAEEEVTYSVVKRGGTAVITLEAISNDDVGLIREIPIGLGRAAAQTLHEFVLDFMFTNAIIYDLTALFTVGHGNLNTVAFSEPEYLNVRRKMRAQTRLSNDKHVGMFSRHLWGPADLESAFFDAFRRDTNNDPKFSQSVAPMMHIIDYWDSDPNNWFVTADKAETPLIELSFWGGRMPQLFIQDNPTQGSMFTNDARTLKMRHVYNGAVIDFRGFQGSIVA